MKLPFLLLTTMIAFAVFAPAMAEDKPAKQETKKEEAKPAEKTESVLKKDAAPPAENVALKKWMDAENALIDPLTPKDREKFLILRNKYSVIRVIGVVESDIGAAVQSCGKNNPDMKEKMDARFKQWKAAVNPIIDTAKKTFERDLANQKLVDVKETKKVLKLHDEAYEEGEKHITKQVVTTKEACEDLLASMDRTEDTMIGLLEKTLLPENVIQQEYERSQKAKAAKAKSEKQKPETAPAEEKPKAD